MCKEEVPAPTKLVWSLLTIENKTAKKLYSSSLLPGRIWHRVILMWGVMHKSRLMCSHHKKCLILSAFLYWDASGTKQWTQLCKVDIAWGNGLLGPGYSDKMLNTTHSEHTHKDGILCLADNQKVANILYS